MFRPLALLACMCLGGLGAALAAQGAQGAQGEGGEEGGRATLAVIINPSNPVTDIKLSTLRSYLKLERRDWPSKRRCEVFLRPSNSTEMRLLLDKVYGMTSAELQKYWVGKIFRGEITSKPAVVPTAEAAGVRVRDVPGAITVVLSEEVPEGVRVLMIDGTRPGDPGYPLTMPVAALDRTGP